VCAVLDTNVIVAAFLTRQPGSPTREILERWRRGEFRLLYSDDLLAEVAGTLDERHVDELLTTTFLREVGVGADRVPVDLVDIRPVIAADPDDDLILACAVAGRATHLVTYDAHFAVLGGRYQGIEIVDALAFLRLLRQQTTL
jgi:putative PIN family toxin of toxin-antitoxin system